MRLERERDMEDTTVTAATPSSRGVGVGSGVGGGASGAPVLGLGDDSRRCVRGIAGTGRWNRCPPGVHGQVLLAQRVRQRRVLLRRAALSHRRRFVSVARRRSVRHRSAAAHRSFGLLLPLFLPFLPTPLQQIPSSTPQLQNREEFLLLRGSINFSYFAASLHTYSIV